MTPQEIEQNREDHNWEQIRFNRLMWLICFCVVLFSAFYLAVVWPNG